MQNYRPISRMHQSRRGWIAPIMGLLLVVILGVVALVLDRLWLDMASSEAQSVADISALAAARQLASDDALRVPAPEDDGRILAATLAAENIASMNRVAGQPYALDPVNGDLKFGVNLQVEETGEIRFVETKHEARTAQVTTQRTYARGNPVALFLQGISGLGAGEVRARAEATIDNHIVGFQTIGDACVPMLPLAILANDPAGKRLDTWQVQIEKHLGPDNYRFDPSTGKVESGADGIPEITLNPAGAKGNAETANMAFVDVHGQVGRFPLAEQIQKGWSSADLERREGRFLFTKGPELFPARSAISKQSADALQSILGECRGALLYQNLTAVNRSGSYRLQSAGLVAGRVMAVEKLGGMEFRIVFQPGVLASRSALRPADLGMADVGAAANKYIYQLKLTQ